jgi:hypothetical protein
VILHASVARLIVRSARNDSAVIASAAKQSRSRNTHLRYFRASLSLRITPSIRDWIASLRSQ